MHVRAQLSVGAALDKYAVFNVTQHDWPLPLCLQVLLLLLVTARFVSSRISGYVVFGLFV